MSIDYYLTLLFLLVAIPGIIFFADWWNRRHGYDKRDPSA